MEGTDFLNIFTRYLPHSCFNNSLPFPNSAISNFLPCGLAMTAKQHGRIWKWIQNNLEIYRNLGGAIYTSPVQKINKYRYYSFLQWMYTVPRYGKYVKRERLNHYV